MTSHYNTPSFAGVYRITCKKSRRSYVGSSKNVAARWKRHGYELKAGKHHSRHLQRAWDKHGKEAFEFVVLEVVTDQPLHEREQHYMDKLKPAFNNTPVAGPPVVHSAASRAKISAAAKRTWACPERRRKQSERVKAAGAPPGMSKRILDLWADPAYREKIAANHRNYTAFGVAGSLKELARAHGVKYNMVKDRVGRFGWDIERALTQPKRKGGL